MLKRTRRLQRTTASAAALLASLLSASLAQAEQDDPEIEEVVVTGSYLQQTAADSPSPLSIVTAADIADLGAADVAEIVQTLPWQSGSQTRASTFGGEGADGRASVNLRNLGHGATLVLDSKRFESEIFDVANNTNSREHLVNLKRLIAFFGFDRDNALVARCINVFNCRRRHHLNAHLLVGTG